MWRLLSGVDAVNEIEIFYINEKFRMRVLSVNTVSGHAYITQHWHYATAGEPRCP